MKKRRSIENKNIQRYMLRTYLILVCISVFIEIILCIYMVGSARKHMVQNHGGNLDQIVYQMDESFAKAEGQSTQPGQPGAAGAGISGHAGVSRRKYFKDS